MFAFFVMSPGLILELAEMEEFVSSEVAEVPDGMFIVPGTIF